MVLRRQLHEVRPLGAAGVGGGQAERLRVDGLMGLGGREETNQAGDLVQADRFRTLELNLPEWDRFQRSVSDVLTGEADLDRMLRDRMRSDSKNAAKIKVETRIEFDDECSVGSTLVQVIAQDRLGLLHKIASRFSHHDCNIEIALIDTEGQMAIDVFYLTSGGAKLAATKQEELKADLLEELQAA